MAQPPVDPNVAVPPSVAAAAKAAETAHARAYNTPPAAPAPVSPPPVQDPPLQPVADPPLQPVTTPPAPPAKDPPLAPPADTPPPPAGDPPAPQTQAQIDWEARYRAMEGRYKQATRTNGVMQEQMRELGNELVQTQQLIQQRGITAAPSATPNQQRLVTEKDVETFGPDFIETVQRAAIDAAQPLLAQVQDQVKQVSQTLTRQQKHQMAQQLSAAVPNWRELNDNDRFKEWASLRDVYSGQVRGKLLNAAIRQGDTSRAIAFFKGFLQEEQATGQLPPPTAPAPTTPARTPALPMEAIAAPGRAQPAAGTQPAQAADKPIITHGQIRAFYDMVRKGQYAGRDADKSAHEEMIFAAQREGRIR